MDTAHVPVSLIGFQWTQLWGFLSIPVHHEHFQASGDMFITTTEEGGDHHRERNFEKAGVIREDQAQDFGCFAIFAVSRERVARRDCVAFSYLSSWFQFLQGNFFGILTERTDGMGWMDGRKKKKAELDLVKPNSTNTQNSIDFFIQFVDLHMLFWLLDTDRIFGWAYLVYGTTTKTCTEGLARKDKKARTRSEERHEGKFQRGCDHLMAE
ncbi:hypothetical protein F5Y04DRAFT_263518 [Hypomontagnella monticulosa]|nr:hypothetical protein F5Y04DRAFT_263518 [Hypomontagnella monticulosa]